jgi:hypothetical protein
MGIGPISSSEVARPASLNPPGQKTVARENGQPSPSSLHDQLLARFAALRLLPGEGKARTKDYETEGAHKAIAVATKAHRTYRVFGAQTDETAIVATLEGCQIFHGEPCTLVAVGDKIEAAPSGPPPIRDMPRTRYAGRFEPDQIPSGDSRVLSRADITSYASIIGPKAAAFHPWGVGRLFVVTSARSQFEAEEQALAQCNKDPIRKGEDGSCFLYAAGDRVVLPQRLRKPVASRK